MPVQHLIRRLIWFSVAPLLLLAVLLPGLELRRDHALRLHEIDDDAQAAARTLESRLALRLKALALLAASASLQGPVGTDLRAFRREAQAYRDLFGSHVILADDARRMLLNTRLPEGEPLPPLPVPAGRSAVEAARSTGQPAAGDRFIGPVARQALVALAAAVPATPGRAAAGLTVLAQLEVAQLQSWLDDVGMSPGGRLLLLDSTGAPLARREAPAQDGDDSSRTWRRRSAAPLDGTPWTLVLEVADPGWRAGLQWTAALLASGMLLAAGLAYAGSRHAGRLLKADLDALVGLPKAGMVAPAIAEVAAARRRLDELAALRDRHEHELEASRTSLQRLLASQDQVQEQERARIARELHDDLQQRLALVVNEAQALKTGALAGAPAGTQSQAAQAMIDDLGAAIVASRRLIADLRPLALQDLGLVAALQALARQTEQGGDCACALVVEPGLDLASLAPESGLALYRVAQEALNNARRHARANVITVSLKRDAAGWRLRVEDDGCGFDAAAPGRVDAFGLVGMRERLHALGGWLRLDSRVGHGTVIEAVLPDPANAG